MSCWVVPSLAADVWQIPLDYLMQRIRDGLVPVMEEDGFTFVDVAPRSSEVVLLPPEQRPPTYSAAEYPPEEPILPQNEVCELSEDEETLVEDESVDDVGSLNLGDWRTARMKTSRTRVPPGRGG